jgi:hypothetical protein
MMMSDKKTRHWKFVRRSSWARKKAMTAFELHPPQVYCIAVMAILNLCRQFYTKKSWHAHYTVCRWLCYMCAGRILEYVGGPAHHIAGLTNPSVWHTFFAISLCSNASLVRGGRLCRWRVSYAFARIDPRASVNLSFFTSSWEKRHHLFFLHSFRI